MLEAIFLIRPFLFACNQSVCHVLRIAVDTTVFELTQSGTSALFFSKPIKLAGQTTRTFSFFTE
jgi:hypothetical protein